VKIDKYEFPDDLYYDAEHNWVRVEGDVVVQGLDDLGQDLAGELVYVEVPRPAAKVRMATPLLPWHRANGWAGSRPSSAASSSKPMRR